MKNDTDITCNWILQENLTEISENKDANVDVLSNLDKEILIKAKAIESINSVSENVKKQEFDLHNLPLFFPQSINAKRISASLNHSQNTQRWIGYVIDKKDKKFKAKLEDITNPGTFEIGTFDIQDAFDEKEMIKLGAVFYLSVGYDVSRGTYTKQKLIRFQRLSEWTENDYNNAIDRADRLSSNLTWE